MVVVTTLDYDQLTTLLKEKRVSLDNETLLFGRPYEAIQKYIEDRLGGKGYVVAIRGEINPKYVKMLKALDPGLKGERLILEAEIRQDDMLTLDAASLQKAVEIINYGLPDDIVEETLDEAVERGPEAKLQIIVAPNIQNNGSIRITSLGREIYFEGHEITVVKPNGEAIE